MKRNLLFTLYMFLVLIFLIEIVYIGVLPIYYVLGIVLLFLMIHLYFLRKVAKGKKFKLKLFIICVLIALIDFEIFNIGYKLYSINKDSTVIVVSTRVLNEDKKIEKVGILKNQEDDFVDEYLNDYSYKVIEYTEEKELVQALYNESIDGAVVVETYAAIYDEENFILKTSSINEKKYQLQNDSILKDVKVMKESFNIYISGNDNYGDILSNTRSDVNMVISINPKTRQILMTSIPRDYYVNLGCKNNSLDKLTHAGLYGVDCSVNTVEDLLDIDINYYVKIDFTSLVNVVDALGGVNIYSDIAFTSYPDEVLIKEGNQLMDGATALAFARERHAYEEGDLRRIVNQQTVLTSIIQKASQPSVVFKANKLLNIVANNVDSNIPSQTMNNFIKLGLNFVINGYDIQTQALKGSDGKKQTYSLGSRYVYVMIPNKESLKDIKDKIAEINN